MNLIKFPGLGLEFYVSKYALKIGNIHIYKYAVFVVLGIVVGLFLSRISKEKFNIKYDFVLESIIGALIFGIIGARLYYVFFSLEKYTSNPLQIFNIRDGGLAIYGGIIAAGIYLGIRCLKKEVNFLDLCDYLVPYLAIGQSIGRWGNFFNVEAYGIQSTNILRMGINTANGYMEVHPTFLYESIGTFLIFLILKILQKHRIFKGEITTFYIMFYSIIRFFIESLRVDSLMFKGTRISQTLSELAFLFSITSFFMGIYLKKKYKE